MIIGVLVISVACVAAAIIFGRARSSGAERKLREQLEQDLRTGTPAETVRRVLQNHQLEYSWLASDRQFRAIKRNVHSSLLSRRDLVLIIQINDKDTVEWIKVEERTTGP